MLAHLILIRYYDNNLNRSIGTHAGQSQITNQTYIRQLANHCLRMRCLQAGLLIPKGLLVAA